MPFWKPAEGTTQELLQLCAGYFFFYFLTGISVKYFIGSPAHGYPGMNGVEFLVYSNAGGMILCLVVVLALRWYRLESAETAIWAGRKWPSELRYIIPSGICTAVVIPTTTLMYTLPISVMVAMVMMRASVIVISRAVDSIQCRQGILKKIVYPEENIAVVIAVLAACIQIFWVKDGGFDFLESPAALIILGSYILAYSLRIYIMNYFKNTRPKGVKQDNKGFFAIEQITASAAILAASIILLPAPRLFSWGTLPQVRDFADAFTNPNPQWHLAFLSGLAYGLTAFFSVFIFMFKGRTATFAGLVNRLTSLVAGTTATLVSFLLFHDKFPSLDDWLSLIFVLIAVGFMTKAEKKRMNELVRQHEIELEPTSAIASALTGKEPIVTPAESGDRDSR